MVNVRRRKRKGEGSEKKKEKDLRVNDGTCNAVVILNRGEMRTPRVFLAFSGAFSWIGCVVWSFGHYKVRAVSPSPSMHRDIRRGADKG